MHSERCPNKVLARAPSFMPRSYVISDPAEPRSKREVMRIENGAARTGPYAHSLADSPLEEWELLADHAEAVGTAASSFAAQFGWGDAGRAAGVLHDAGKCSAEFQSYLRAEDRERARRVDHSTKGARIAAEKYKGELGRLLAACIAGHHAGLPDPDELDRRLDPAHTIPEASCWPDHVPSPPEIVRPTRKFAPAPPQQKAFSVAFLARMLFSCLVDADFLATERFLSGGAIRRGVAAPLQELRCALADHMARLEQRAGDAELNALRATVRAHAVARAAAAPGLFTLTVPTGGGKTLTSLSFALAHALRHDKRRIIYVIPFTSIIEQTAAVFREALGRPDAVLEHHASFDWERAASGSAYGGDEHDGLGVLRRAAENWDAPIVVTTAVQFFESLFAARTSSCCKLHNTPIAW